MVKTKFGQTIFGKRFGLSDLILILLLLPAIYFVYMGIDFNSGFLAVYQDFIAMPLAFTIIGKLFIQNIINLAKKQ